MNFFLSQLHNGFGFVFLRCFFFLYMSYDNKKVTGFCISQRFNKEIFIKSLNVVM